MRYFYSDNGTQKGPVSYEDLKKQGSVRIPLYGGTDLMTGKRPEMCWN